jgi:hypothetical protein
MSDRFEKELKAALKPVDPGGDFTDSVMARVKSMDPPAKAFELSGSSHRLRPRWLIGLAASIIAAVGIVQVQESREAAAGLRARQQVLAALQVTSEKLNLAYRVVNDQPGIEIESDAADR